MTATHCSECGAPVPTFTGETAPESNVDVSVAPETLARHVQLMSTNTPPREAELVFIRAVMSKTGARLACLDEQILKLRTQLERLEDERSFLSKYEAQNTAIVSPLRRMPPEVLAQIFSWTLPPTHDAMDRPDFDTRSPWMLTHVSRHWRAVAISTPSLWSLVAVSFYRTKTLMMSMLKAQLERARTLRVRFFVSPKKPAAPQLQLFQLLAEHSPRWETLTIGLTSELVPLLARTRNRLPLLRQLEIKWASSESQAGVEAMNFFQTAPSLLSFGTYNRYRSIHIPLPAHQLTRYHLDGPWEVHQAILKLAKNLREVHIAIAFAVLWPDPVEFVHLAVLRRLHISHAAILAYLRAPAVHAISYTLDTAQDPDLLLRHLEAFVERSGCSLRRLGLQGTASAHITATILGKFPSISELDILIRGDEPDTGWDTPHSLVNILISHMTIPNPTGNAVIAPHLSKIYFGCLERSSIDYELYLRMLRSRWNSDDSVLRSAALLVDSGAVPDFTTRSGLIALRRAGLDLFLLEGREASEELRSWVCTDWI